VENGVLNFQGCKPRNYSFIEYAVEALFIYINFDFGDHSNNSIHYWKKATG
jgi:hypothetical protein